MAMNLDYPPGATPLDPDEAAGLIPSHIANHGQLLARALKCHPAVLVFPGWEAMIIENRKYD